VTEGETSCDPAGRERLTTRSSAAANRRGRTNLHLKLNPRGRKLLHRMPDGLAVDVCTTVTLPDNRRVSLGRIVKIARGRS
jgi:hypothetical protein